jgi:hypothetical protein
MRRGWIQLGGINNPDFMSVELNNRRNFPRKQYASEPRLLTAAVTQWTCDEVVLTFCKRIAPMQCDLEPEPV